MTPCFRSRSNPVLLRARIASAQTKSSPNKAAEFCSCNVLFLVEKCQAACKPGSVPACAGDGHSSGTPVAGRLARPTRTAARKCAICRPYSVLLPVGFAVPPPLPEARCALTAPFHPYPAFARALRRGGLLSVALSLGSPPPAVNRHRTSVEPGLSSRGRVSPLPARGHPAA